MRAICIIPARGGSKRIPRKNIKPFFGKPIIAYSIEAALESNIFSEIIVSTDCEEIAEVSKEHGATVPFMRSEKTSDDYAALTDVIDEVLLDSEIKNLCFDYAACLLATAPLVRSRDLVAGFRELGKSDARVVCPVVPFEYPVQRALKISDGRLTMLDEEQENVRSQDLEKTFHDAGQWYWIRLEDGKSPDNLLSGPTKPYPISLLSAHDIDTLEDWKLAELKYQLMVEENEISDSV